VRRALKSKCTSERVGNQRFDEEHHGWVRSCCRISPYEKAQRKRKAGAEKDLVRALGRFVGEPGRAHDHPLQATAFDYLLLSVFVGVLISNHEG
jgi:hypothetical protein